MAATSGQSRRRRGQPTLPPYVATVLGVAASILSIAAGGATDGAGQPEIDSRIANAWRVLRVVDCARCHGKDYTGLAAPSVIVSRARDGGNGIATRTEKNFGARCSPRVPGMRRAIFGTDVHLRFDDQAAATTFGQFRAQLHANERFSNRNRLLFKEAASNSWTTHFLLPYVAVEMSPLRQL